MIENKDSGLFKSWPNLILTIALFMICFVLGYFLSALAMDIIKGFYIFIISITRRGI